MKFHNLFAVVSAACSEPLLGNSKATCNGMATDDVIVDYGVAGNMITLCIQNEKNNDWIALGPGTGMEGTVVGFWGFGGTDGINAFDIVRGAITAIGSTKLGYTNEEAAMTQTSPNTNNGMRKLCFDIPDTKIDGTMANAKFMWARGKAGGTTGTLAVGSQNKHAASGDFALDLCSAKPSGKCEVSADETTTVAPNVTTTVAPNVTTTVKTITGEESFLDKTVVRIAGVFVVLLAVGVFAYFFYFRQKSGAKAAVEEANMREHNKFSKRSGVSRRERKQRSGRR